MPDLFHVGADARNRTSRCSVANGVTTRPISIVVYIGLAGSSSAIDTRALALKDVTAVGVLSASPGLADTIAAYASGAVDPRPLVSATVGLDQVGDVLSGVIRPAPGTGPKVHVDPWLTS